MEGTNADGSSYRGTAEITGSGPDYRIEWTTGSSTSSGRGTVEGDRFEASFSGSLTGTGTAVYRVEDDGRLVGTWTVEGFYRRGHRDAHADLSPRPRPAYPRVVRRTAVS